MGKEKVRFTTNLDKELLYKIKIYAVKENKFLNEIIEEHFAYLLEEQKKESNNNKALK